MVMHVDVEVEPGFYGNIRLKVENTNGLDATKIVDFCYFTLLEIGKNFICNDLVTTIAEEDFITAEKHPHPETEWA